MAWALSTWLGLSGIGACRGSVGWVSVVWVSCGSQSGDLVPGGESSGHLGAIVVSGEPMAAGPEVRGDHAEHRQEPLGSAGGAEAFSWRVRVAEVGRWEFSARLFRYLGCRCSTAGITVRWAGR